MPPNVLLITTHDTGRHLGCYGVETVRSPNLDRLAEGGCRFTNYFAASALCSPSRGAMMTGRYPQNNGMLGLSHAPWWWSLNEGEKHLSHLLHGAGYYTALFGHQHETSDVDAQLCFDEHGLHRRPDSGLHTTCGTVADGVCRFLSEEAADRAPFYLQVGFFETHRPFDFGGVEPDDELGVHVPPYLKDTDAVRAELAHLQGAVRRMDGAVGRILDALRENGLRDDTLVVYSVDHGIPFPRAKTTLYDPGIGIALLMRLPGVVPPDTTCDGLLSNVDLVPTLLQIAGVDPPGNLDGSSFASAFDGGAGRERIFAEQCGHGGPNELRCVRTERYKLIRNFGPQRRLSVPVDVNEREQAGTLPFVQLFDLEEDPLEVEDVSEDDEYAEVLRELDAALHGWMAEVEDPLLSGPIATPYYRRAMADYREGPRR
ncbi:MAG: sulfatase [Planctomycetota bacterium]